MSQTNQLDLRLPEKDYAEIKAAIETLRAKLLPQLKTLSPQERRKLLRFGDRSVAFVQKTYEYGSRYERLVPSFLDMKALAADIKAVQLLQDLGRSLAPICQALDDSLKLAGSEAYEGSLLFYQSVKAAARSKDPDAKPIVDDLSARFKIAKKN